MRPQEHFGRQSAATAPQRGESSEGSAARIIPSLGTTSFRAFLGRGQLCQKAWFYAHEYLLLRVEKNVMGQMTVRSICRYPLPAFAPESLKFKSNLYQQPLKHTQEVWYNTAVEGAHFCNRIVATPGLSTCSSVRIEI